MVEGGWLLCLSVKAYTQLQKLQRKFVTVIVYVNLSSLLPFCILVIYEKMALTHVLVFIWEDDLINIISS